MLVVVDPVEQDAGQLGEGGELGGGDYAGAELCVQA